MDDIGENSVNSVRCDDERDELTYPFGQTDKTADPLKFCP